MKWTASLFLVMLGFVGFCLPHDAAAGGDFPSCVAGGNPNLLSCSIGNADSYNVRTVSSTVSAYDGAEDLDINFSLGDDFSAAVRRNITIKDREMSPKSAKLIERCRSIALGCRDPALWLDIKVNYWKNLTSLTDSGVSNASSWTIELPDEEGDFSVFGIECHCQPDPVTQ